jgi:hypothetical protein
MGTAGNTIHAIDPGPAHVTVEQNHFCKMRTRQKRPELARSESGSRAMSRCLESPMSGMLAG